MLGYSMRIPVHSLWRDLPGAGPEAWRSFLQFDVLQTIGFTLIILQLLVLVLRTPRRLATVAGLLAVGIRPQLRWRGTVLS